MTELIANNKIKVRHFHSTERFIDDFNAMTVVSLDSSMERAIIKNLDLSYNIRALMYPSEILMLI